MYIKTNDTLHVTFLKSHCTEDNLKVEIYLQYAVSFLLDFNDYSWCHTICNMCEVFSMAYLLSFSINSKISENINGSLFKSKKMSSKKGSIK